MSGQNSKYSGQIIAGLAVGIAFVVFGFYAFLYTSWKIGLLWMGAGLIELIVLHFVKKGFDRTEEYVEEQTVPKGEQTRNVLKFAGGIGFVLGFMFYLNAYFLIGFCLIFISGYLFIANSDETYSPGQIAAIIGLGVFILLVSQGEIEEAQEGVVVRSVCAKLRDSYPTLESSWDTGGTDFKITFDTEEERKVFIQKAKALIGDRISEERIPGVFGSVHVIEKKPADTTGNQKPNNNKVK